MKHFVLLALLVMAFAFMPAIASEPTAPPGITAASIGTILQVDQAAKEFNVIGFDLVALSAYNIYPEKAVTQEQPIALVGIGSAPAVESTIYTVPMLAGLMRGFEAEEYCVIAAASGYEYMTDIGACRVLVA